MSKTNRVMTTPILPSGRPQGSGAGWGLVLAGYVVLLLLVFGHEPTPEAAAPPAPAPRQPIAQPEEPPAEEPPPLFDESPPEPAAAPEPGTPEALDRDAIEASLGRVRSQILACGERNPTPGVVKLRVEVAASGRVSRVEVQQTPERRLGACVASAMKRARFDVTLRGGSFTSPFSF